MLDKRLLDRLGERVSSKAGGFQLPEEGEGLLAERVFDQLRLARAVTPEDLAEPVGLGFDAAALPSSAPVPRRPTWPSKGS